MTWSERDTWVVVTGILCAASCAVPGSFLLLRRMSLMGDAISHAVLPGLAAAFWLTESRGSWVMFAGAAAAGLLTAMMTEWVRKAGKVDEGASMGVVFTALFAVGLIMIVRAAHEVDLDPGCVLYGAIELTPIDTVEVMGWSVPRSVLMLGGCAALNWVVYAALSKELKISTFDPELATTVGINAGVMHYVLMTMTAVTSVAAFESVGSILVVAMLIVPAATAHLLTERLGRLVACAAVIGGMAAGLGHASAVLVPRWMGAASTSTAGMMAVCAGVLFAGAALFAPQHGVVSRAARMMRLRLRIVEEDVLGVLYRARERGEAGMSRREATKQTGASGWATWVAVRILRASGAVKREGSGIALGERGAARGAELVRGHRLWERYLHDAMQVRADHVHETAERLEHVTGPGLREQLAKEAGQAERDPHGRRIPE